MIGDVKSILSLCEEVLVINIKEIKRIEDEIKELEKKIEDKYFEAGKFLFEIEPLEDLYRQIFPGEITSKLYSMRRRAESIGNYRKDRENDGTD